RAQTLKAGGLFHPVSREGALVLNNLFLTTATASVLIGTLYPLLLESLTGNKISVGAPFFNLTFGPLMVPLLLAVSFGPLLAWKRGDLAGVGQRLMAAFAISLAIVAAVLLFVDKATLLAALGAGLAAWLMLGSLTDLVVKAGAGKASLGVMGRRLAGLPGSVFGTMLAHFGLGVTVLGIVAVTSFETENILTMKQGDTLDVAGYTLRFDGVVREQGPNYIDDRADFALLNAAGTQVDTISSAKRLYTARRMPTTEAGIKTFVFSQLYVSLGDPGANGQMVVRVWYKPLVTLIWIGSLFMMAGGMASLADRRLRVGAPSSSRKPSKAATGAAA
ncbi:MAG: heme lyase NrfEFG subunit NrfE, partial [Notoacmeibacter sp.]|nr:heme lyase NrfEFG subunit NrfE [Notoacmeibacter sp.]